METEPKIKDSKQALANMRLLRNKVRQLMKRHTVLQIKLRNLFSAITKTIFSLKDGGQEE